MVRGVADLLAADAEEAALLVRAGHRLGDGHHERLVGIDLLRRALRREDRDRVAQVLGGQLADVPTRRAQPLLVDRGRRLDQLVEQGAVALTLPRLPVDAAPRAALAPRR